MIYGLIDTLYFTMARWDDGPLCPARRGHARPVPLLAVALVILRKLRPDLAPEAPAAEPQLREARNEPG